MQASNTMSKPAGCHTEHSSPTWGNRRGGPRSRALFLSFRNKGSNFAPVSKNVT